MLKYWFPIPLPIVPTECDSVAISAQHQSAWIRVGRQLPGELHSSMANSLVLPVLGSNPHNPKRAKGVKDPRGLLFTPVSDLSGLSLSQSNTILLTTKLIA